MAHVRWLAPAWTSHPFSARRCRVRNPLNGAIADLSPDEHAVLTACDGCGTLDDYRALVFRKLGVRDEHRATVSAWLEGFARNGLLVPLDELVGRVRSPHAAKRPAFAGVFVRTCDRPALLKRLLASAENVERRFGNRYCYAVLDDSRDASNREANARTVEKTFLRCRYVNLHEARLANELQRAFPDARHEIEWLLGTATGGEPTYGRPVNFALLLSAGRTLLMIDDDALLDARRPALIETGFAVTSDSDELFCFPNWTALDVACPPIDVDPIGGHLSYVGESIHSLWSKLVRESAPLAVVSLHATDASRFASDARVVLTQNHAIGDPGAALFPFHVLNLPDASRDNLLGRAGDKAYALHERINWRGQSRPRLSPNRPLTFTTLAGLDNSRPLPPVVRSHRNEDLFLGEIIRHVYPSSWFFDLPWGLPHLRTPPKYWLPSTSDFAQEPLHFLIDYVEQRAAGCIAEHPEHRMRALAAELFDIAAAPEALLDDLVQNQAADTAARVRFAINEQLDDNAVSPDWKSVLKPWLDSPALSMDRDAIRGRTAHVDTVRDIAANYARALEIWPMLWEYCRTAPLVERVDD